jgi:hypothetical protein
MKRGSFILLTLLVFLYLFTGVLFAQTIPKIALAGKAEAQITTLTPTPKAAQPTTNPTSTVTQTPTPTEQVTTAPTPKIVQPTNVPAQTEKTQSPEPTMTPIPITPTPTPKPKPVVLPINKPPTHPPINNIITAPFDLVMSSLPQIYYSDEGLAPATNKVLIALAFFFLLSGTILLNWQALVRTTKKLFAPTLRQRKSFPYATGRV